VIPAALVMAALALAGGDEVVARVGDVAITAVDVKDRAARRRPPKTAAPRPEALVSDLIDDVLLAAEGRRLGLAERFVVKVSLQTARRNILGEAFVEREIAALYQPSEEQLRELFHQREDQIRAVVLTYTSQAEAAAAKARLEASADLKAEAARSLVQARAPPRAA
jgi:hypothetical protein